MDKVGSKMADGLANDSKTHLDAINGIFFIENNTLIKVEKDLEEEFSFNIFRPSSFRKTENEIKKEIQESNEDNFDIKEEPLISDEECNVHSAEVKCNVKPTNVKFIFFKEKNYAQKVQDDLPTKVGIHTKSSDGQPRVIKAEKSFANLKNGRTFDEKKQQMTILRPCSVVLEDCMKKLGSKVVTSSIPQRRLSSATKHRTTRSKLNIHESKNWGTEFHPHSQLFAHQRMPTKEVEVHFRCKRCGMRFACRSHFVMHLRMHTGEKPYLCKNCGESFSLLTHLNAHKRMHKDKSYFCKDCGKRFSQLNYLDVHQRMHAAEKPSFCKYCGKRFHKDLNLVTHRRSSHTVSYHCKDCGKTFPSSSSLNFIRHLRMHARDKSNFSKGRVDGFTQTLV